MNEQVLLREEQNLNFDKEFFGRAEFVRLVEMLRARFDRPINVLDVGGGNGKFLDRIIESIPTRRVVNIDISGALLELNQSNKVIIKGSILDHEFGPMDEADKFDLITVNWVLHHMVGASDAQCRKLQLQTLEACARILSKDGVIAVAENDYRSWVSADFSSRLIYEVTKSNALKQVARRYANTAGVGVRFRPEAGWRRLFSISGLRVDEVFYGQRWRTHVAKRVFLGMRAPGHVHFLLSREN